MLLHPAQERKWQRVSHVQAQQPVGGVGLVLGERWVRRCLPTSILRVFAGIQEELRTKTFQEVQYSLHGWGVVRMVLDVFAQQSMDRDLGGKVVDEAPRGFAGGCAAVQAFKVVNEDAAERKGHGMGWWWLKARSRLVGPCRLFVGCGCADSCRCCRLHVVLGYCFGSTASFLILLQVIIPHPPIPARIPATVVHKVGPLVGVVRLDATHDGLVKVGLLLVAGQDAVVDLVPR